MNLNEIEVIIALLRSISPIESVVEIGVNEGYTAKAILNNIESITMYYGIDVKQSYIPSIPSAKREIPRNPGHAALNFQCFHLKLFARGSLDLLPDDFRGVDNFKFDAWFIDGDHGTKAVEHDTMLAINSVRPGGMIIWHDYVKGRSAQVAEVLEAWQKDRGYDIKYVENTWLAFLRVPT